MRTIYTRCLLIQRNTFFEKLICGGNNIIIGDDVLVFLQRIRACMQICQVCVPTTYYLPNIMMITIVWSLVVNKCVRVGFA